MEHEQHLKNVFFFMRALIRYLNTIHLFFSYYKFMTCFFINIIKSGRQFLKFMIMTI
jgi:hypothetical protein